jgi:serine/threonine protein kinase
MADRIDTQIAGYRIESLISRGGMGEVYLAEQDAPRRKVALKLLSPELSLDAGFRERFARESEAAASIDHPNVIPIYQYSGLIPGRLNH